MIETIALLAALVPLAVWVAAPLYRAGPPVREERGDDRARGDALLAALRELEWDHRSGLISDAEYRRHKAELEAEAAILGPENTAGHGHD